MGSLSGGEKARLVLAMLVWQRPNLLLLDEPTNHLDLTTREALSMALNEFEGTVMLVSHDRALLRETCDEFWLVTRGGVLPFDGDLDDYQRWLLEVSRATARGCRRRNRRVRPRWPRRHRPRVPPTRRHGTAPPPAPARREARAQQAAPPPASRDERKGAKQSRARLAESTRPLRVELQRIDERLARLGQEKAEVESLLSQPGAQADDFAELWPPPGARAGRDGDARGALAAPADGARDPADRRLIASGLAGLWPGGPMPGQVAQAATPASRSSISSTRACTGVSTPAEGSASGVAPTTPPSRQREHAPHRDAGGHGAPRGSRQRAVHAAVAGAGDHEALRAGRHQRVAARAARAGVAGDDLHPGQAAGIAQRSRGRSAVGASGQSRKRRSRPSSTTPSGPASPEPKASTR